MPDVVTYDILFRAFEKGWQPERALELFDSAKQQGLLLDVVAYSALISALEKAEQERALDLFVAMKWEGMVADVITYGALMNACDKGE